jgi:hypothetical protein
VSQTILPTQKTSGADLVTLADETVNISSAVVEELVMCLSEVLKLMEVGAINESNPSGIRERCFLSLGKIGRLLDLLNLILDKRGR